MTGMMLKGAALAFCLAVGLSGSGSIGTATASDFRVHGVDRPGASAVDRLQTRLERTRVRTELNRLSRQSLRLRSDRGTTARFGPEPGAGREGRRRAIDGRLARLDRDVVLQRGRLSQIERRLADQDRPTGRRVPLAFEDRPAVPLLPSAALLGLPVQDREAASEAAREIVNQLLRANEARTLAPE